MKWLKKMRQKRTATMKNAARLLLSILVVAAVSLCLAGCKGNGEHPSDEHPAQDTNDRPAEEHPAGEHPAGEHPAGEHPR